MYIVRVYTAGIYCGCGLRECTAGVYCGCGLRECTARKNTAREYRLKIHRGRSKRARSANRRRGWPFCDVATSFLRQIFFFAIIPLLFAHNIFTAFLKANPQDLQIFTPIESPWCSKTPKHTVCRWRELQPHYACLGVPNPLPPSTHTYAT